MDIDVWRQRVGEGLRLGRSIRANQWAISDLAAKLAQERGGASIASVMRRWLTETRLECSAGTLERMRLTAEAWPPSTRVADCGFGVHFELRAHPDRFALIRPNMSGVEARKLARDRPGLRSNRGCFPDALRYLDASRSYLRSALRALGDEPVDGERAEIIGLHIARLEEGFDDFLQRVDMADELASVA